MNKQGSSTVAGDLNGCAYLARDHIFQAEIAEKPFEVARAFLWKISKTHLSRPRNPDFSRRASRAGPLKWLPAFSRSQVSKKKTIYLALAQPFKSPGNVISKPFKSFGRNHLSRSLLYHLLPSKKREEGF